MRIDDIDIKILSLLSRNPEMCQEEIAKEVGITQPAVCLRLKKLRKAGIPKKTCGMDVKSMGMKIVIARGKGNIEWLARNPYLVVAFNTGDGVIAVFAGENRETAEACAKMMMDRIDEMYEADNFIGEIGLPVKADGRCAVPCDQCSYYGKCVGLAWSKWYRGKIFNLASP